MSQVTMKTPLARARQWADLFLADIRDSCLRVEVAGSIRRRRPEVGDVEIVAIPKLSTDLLGGEGDSLLDPVLDGMVG